MIAARLLQIITSVAALVAVSLGMATYTHADFTSIHMLFGLIVALALLILALMAVFTRGLRRLVGDWHWLIQTAHLLVSFGAIPFLGMISAGFLRRK